MTSLPLKHSILFAFVFFGAALAAHAAEDSSAVGAQIRPWTDYQVIMWVGDSPWKRPDKVPLFFERLKEMGINTGMVYSEGNPKPFLQHQMPYYVENIVNRGLCLKFSSKVTDWEAFVTGWARVGRPESALVRDYCLDDPKWRQLARETMRSIAAKNATNMPIAYDIRDELSTTISANPFDYDFNPITLAAFRRWLQSSYETLPQLNKEWQTSFPTWDDVKPFTTDQIKNRMASGEPTPAGQPDWRSLAATRFNLSEARKSPTRWNFAPWADFRSYMDTSLARALADIREAALQVDPRTPVGIEGTQMPHAFGGYDLWKLSQVLDWVEPYDVGNAREIFGSFMPGKPLLTTVFESATGPAQRRLWHLLLEGDRGCIIWWSEDSLDWSSDDYRLTPKARALAPVLKELTSPLARLFLNAERERDPIYLHYSQPSIQAAWLIESTVDGSTWLRRFSSFEADHNRHAKIRNGWLKLFQDLGYSPVFLSSEQLEAGKLADLPQGALVLPQSWALSKKEVAAMEQLSRSGSGILFWDGTPGVFNEHCRLVGSSPSVFGADAATELQARTGQKSSSTHPGSIAAYPLMRLKSEAGSAALRDWARTNLGTLKPEIEITTGDCVRVHRLRSRRARLLAFERNINYQMSEDLKQAGGNEPLEAPIQVEARLKDRRHVYDLQAGSYVGLVDRLQFTLDPWHPSLFAVTETRLNEDVDLVGQLSE